MRHPLTGSPAARRTHARGSAATLATVATVLALAPGVPSPGSAARVAAQDARWWPPLAGQLVVSGPYAAPPTPYTAGHRGIDMPALPGATASAPATGTVEFVGRVVDRDTVTVRVDAETVYSLEPVTSHLAVGDQIARGGALGTVSDGGHCADECVHLGVRVAGEYVSPMRYLLGAPILLPWGEHESPG
ncbi:peptidoglycan DD-metalloendopeptidase family protein [Leucobacter luti]|uniref:Peptidase M23-like protein n=1 Tax=Leucobacter luti TaxID=340320 RepID=A0A4Q7TUR1_9MICO|nr:peptidoglycan DD-metalloendopeptidase family protein [Leucobacter luti]MBL3698253.1 M23 family metallopeptidase [Leucobacter luti]RZT64664.1 peptidase M23-like protein [Leucobacter luti]